MSVLESPNSYQLTILLALQRLNKHVYGGTVTYSEKTRRRAANKRSSAMRKHNLMR